MKAEHTFASYNGRDFTSKIATMYGLQIFEDLKLLDICIFQNITIIRIKIYILKFIKQQTHLIC
jgi:hypothetical protein